jgi:phenylpyruvate tautomerase PptA (4-oxalocrotonate tautomerase family)
MPLLRITYQRGTLDQAQKARLAAEVTPVLLVGEVGSDTPQGRAATYVIFEEKDPATEWFVGGEPDNQAPVGGRFLFEIWYLEGAATQTEKSNVHAKMNDIIAGAFGLDGSFPNRLGDWVIINEVPEGAWGASGATVGIAAANDALGGAPERAEYYERHLAAKRRVAENHAFPVDRA